MIKYASNAFLAAKISFINDMADLCEELGADVRMVAKGMGLDVRIGSQFLNAGIGYGGSCFPKDVESLIAVARALERPSAYLEAVRYVNEQRVPHFIDRIRAIEGDLTGKTIAVLGMTFKPNTDDLRESRPLDLCRQLLKEGVIVRAHDPINLPGAAREVPGILCCESGLDAATGADVVIIATEWKEYTTQNLSELRQVMRGDLLADGRNCFTNAQVEAAGLRYLSVGRSYQSVPLA
jgi:UDPglucose 6-dehydrogenase